MSKEGNLAAKERMEAAVAAGDWDTANACMDPDFILHEPVAFPFGGDWRGLAGMREFSVKSREAMKADTINFMKPLIGEDPDLIAYHVHLTGKVTSNGKPFDSTILELIQFKNGKLLSARPHWFNPPDWS